MKILNLLPRLVVLSCIALLGFYCPVSLADKRPIITLSVGLPFFPREQSVDPKEPIDQEIEGKSAYIIKIFANGHVEYNGLYLMDVIGKREYQMDKATLKALLKKIEKESALLIKKEQERGFPSLINIRYTRTQPNIGVRVRLGQKEVTFVGEDTGVLQMDIIKATKAEQWGTENAAVHLNRD